MALVFSSPSGPAGAIVPLDTALGAVQSQVVEVGASSAAKWSTYSFKEDFEYVGVVDLGAIPLAGVNVPTGEGNWFAAALVSAGLFQIQGISAPDHPGTLRIDTGATISSIAYVRKGGALIIAAQLFPFQADEIEQSTAILQLPLITSIRLLVGWTVLPSTVTPANAALFVFDTLLSPNWLATCRRAGVQTQVDTGVPVVAATFYRLELRQVVVGTITFYVSVSGGPSAQVASIDTNVPGTVGVCAACTVSCLAASSRGVTLDYIDLDSKLLAR